MIDVSDIRLDNQRIWDAFPDRATEVALEAIKQGGFGEDHLGRRVSDYEGQVMAIRRGWAERHHEYGYRTTEAGWLALEESGYKRPKMLPATDGWHGCAFTYLAREVASRDGRALELFTKCNPAYGSLGMSPVLNVEQATALRDFLNQWIGEVDRANG